MGELDYLIDYLLNEDKDIDFKYLENIANNKKELLRALMNIREPGKLSMEFIKIQDKYLKEEIKSNGITKIDELESIKDIASKSILNSDKIYLWQGDITTIEADAIVNAANKYLLGCRVPLHYCIDNAIHSFAGLQLRNECFDIINKQGFYEPTGKAQITKAYNLPSKYIIHTVGPIISGDITKEDIDLLKSSYYECMKKAEEYKLNSLVFCSISTGEFSFPKELASKIALKTVDEFLNGSKYLKKVVFNVFSKMDYENYEKIIKVGLNEKE